MATVIKLLPSLQHLNIRILDKEQLEKITDELVEDIEKLDCLEIPFSSVLLSGLDFVVISNRIANLIRSINSIE